MKKFACLILFGLLLNGCDDGNLTVDQIDFDTVLTSTSCDTTNTLIYKLKSQEALLLQLPQGSLVNDPTALDTLTYNIDNSNYRVVYRAYDGTVATSNICGAIPPKTPNVVEEWLGTGGQIKITTKQNLSAPNATDGSTRINGYTHSIVFKNITFLKPAGPQTEEEYIFGDYILNLTPPTLAFSKPTEANECTPQKQVYNYNSTFYIMIQNFDQSLFKNEATPAGKPLEGTISATQNNVVYRPITGTLTSDYFCQNPAPTNPSIKETWNGTTGTVLVTTEISAGIVIHTIVLKDVLLKKGNSSFSLGNNFSLGTIKKAAN